nr:MAG TPA: hypothetical protein [Caudoviricetes sp.]DAV96425.1 MAG TPA: hypothetical protein [Caudoviricetes sp.]
MFSPSFHNLTFFFLSYVLCRKVITKSIHIF